MAWDKEIPVHSMYVLGLLFTQLAQYDVDKAVYSAIS